MPVDAALIEAAPAPRLVCDNGTTAALAPVPDPTHVCVRPNGTRHGPFTTLFPNDTIEIRGSFRDGVLDGAWTRLHANGAIAEDGRYAGGRKDGAWKQLSTSGALLGEYTLANGTGVEKQWYETGALYSERSLKDGVPHGPHKVFAPDGTQVIAARYDAGKLDGPHWFGTRGTMRFEETFESGVLRGSRDIWSRGVMIADENRDRRGRLDGAYTLWRRAKVMRAKGQFAAGKRVGAWTWFDTGNTKEREGVYVAGKRDGVWREWFAGTLTFSGTYAAGKPHGELIHYDRAGRELGKVTIKNGTGTLLTFHANKKASSRTAIKDGLRNGVYQELTQLGKVVVDGRYQNDLQHGTWKQLALDGTLTLEQTYKRGALDGPLRKYVDGKLATEATYADGKRTGPYAEHRDGKPAVTGQYDADRKHGTWTTYAADGSVLLTATYDHGVLAGPWHQQLGGAVLEGTMVAGRRAGTWTRTDRAGTVSKLTYPTP